MKTQNQISSRLRLLGVAFKALAALAMSTQLLRAGTSWTGGGGADTTVTNDLNWGGVVNSLNGTTAASFANSSNLCTLNTNAYFTTVTFSPQSAAGGFTIAGPSNLVVKGSTSGGSKNITVSNGSFGNATNNAPLQVNTNGAGGLLVMQVNKAVTLAINNGISASSGTYTLRYEGAAGSTARIAGPITGLAGVQMASGTWAGDLIIAGNQSLGSTDVTINNSAGYGIPALTARLLLGESLSDLQTWRNFTLNRFMDVVMNGNITAGSFAVQSNAIVDVPGSLSATTLTLGTSGQTGNLKVSGTAYFSGAVSIGASAGNTIVGNSASVGTLALSSGTISGNVTLGGVGANENNLTLIKTNSGTLTLGGTHTYTGATLVQAGRLDLTGSIASSVTVSDAASLGGEGSTTGSVTFSPGTENFYFDPTTGGALTANTINASGATVIVNPGSSASGVVMQSTTTPNGITGTVGVNFVSGARGNLTLNGTADTLSFTPTGAATLTWKGGAANPTFWDVITTTNWNNGTERFYSSDSVRFDDSASSFTVAVQGTSISPGSTVFSNNVNTYTLSGGSITGTGPVTKSGSGTVNVTSGGHNFSGGLTVNAGTLNLLSPVANNFTGGVTNNGGSLVISNINQIGATAGGASLNSINLNGGTFSYTGPTVTSDTLSVNLLGGTSTIDVNDTATGTNIYTLRTGAAITGGGNLIKTGNGDLTFGKNSVGTLGNTFIGKITVKGGILGIRNPDSLGDVVGMTEVTNATLLIYPFGQTLSFSIDPEPVAFSGNSEFHYQPPSSTVNTYVTWTGPMTNSGNLNLTSYPNTNGATLVIQSDIVNNGATTLNFGLSTNGATTNVNNITVSGVISGSVAVTTAGKNGSLYTLSGVNTYTGNTTLNGGTLALTGSGSIANSPVITVNSNGVLDVSSVSFTLGAAQKLTGNGSINGSVTANGTIVPGASVGTLTFSNDLTINGNLVVELNKSLVQSNDFIHVLGTLNNTGTGTLTVSNVGPGLVAGDKFTLFSQVVPNGQNLTIVPPAGVTFTNNLADDGSITVLTAPALTPPTLSFTNLGGGNLQFTWSGGGNLQAQTNSLSTGLGTNWVDYPGSSGIIVPVNPANGSVFFRVKQ